MTRKVFFTKSKTISDKTKKVKQRDPQTNQTKGRSREKSWMRAKVKTFCNTACAILSIDLQYTLTEFSYKGLFVPRWQLSSVAVSAPIHTECFKK